MAEQNGVSLQVQTPMVPIGVSGLRSLGGYVREEYLQELTGPRGIQTLKKMRDNSPIVGAILHATEMLLRPVGWSCTPADESTQAAELAAFARHALFDDCLNTWYVRLSDILSMLPFGWCLPGDQVILSGTGTPQRIVDVKEGDLVLTKYGRARKVLHRFVRHHTGEMMSVHMRGYPFPVRLTPQHLLPTTTGWRAAGDLRVGDEVLRPRLPLHPGGDYETGWLVGAYLAEGHRRSDARTTVIFSVHRKEASLLKQRLDAWLLTHTVDLRQQVETLQRAGASLREIMRQTGHSFKTIKRWATGAAPRNDVAHICYPQSAGYEQSASVSLSRQLFREVIDTWVSGHDAATKALRQLPIETEFAHGILDGWMWGDGHVGTYQGKKSAVGATISPAMAAQLQLIAGSLGIPAPLSWRKGKPMHETQVSAADVWMVGMIPERRVIDKRLPERETEVRMLRQSGMSIRKIAQQLGLTWETVKHWLSTEGPQPHRFQLRIYESAIGHPVTAVERHPYDDLVYDLEVEEDHTFCAGPMIVSNSLHEWTLKRRQGPHRDPWRSSSATDGRLGFADIGLRAQDTLAQWVFNERDEVEAMMQQPPQGGAIVTIPRAKCLLFRPTSYKSNPEGRSILRNAYRSWYNLTQIENIEGIGIERDLAGLPVVKVPPEVMAGRGANASAEARLVYQQYEQLAINIRQNEQAGIVFPLVYDQDGHELYKVELLTSGGRRNFDTDQVIKRYELRIAQSVLADMILVGHEQVGSYALASSKTNLFATALGGYLDAISDVFQQEALPVLWQVNGLPLQLMPHVEHGDVEHVDIKELSEAIKNMAQAGFSVEDLERPVRLKMGLPAPEEEDLG